MDFVAMAMNGLLENLKGQAEDRLGKNGKKSIYVFTKNQTQLDGT